MKLYYIVAVNKRRIVAEAYGKKDANAQLAKWQRNYPGIFFRIESD